MLIPTLLIALLAAETPEIVPAVEPPTADLADEGVVVPLAEADDTAEEEANDPRPDVTRTMDVPAAFIAYPVVVTATASTTLVVAPRALATVSIDTPTTNPTPGVIGTAVRFDGTVLNATTINPVVTLKWELRRGANVITGAPLDSGDVTHSNAAASPMTWSVSLPFTGMSPGAHTLRIVATQKLGGMGVAVRNLSLTGSGTTPPPPTEPPPPRPDQGPQTSGDIHKDADRCGIGSGISTLLLTFGTLAALQRRRRIE